VARIRVRYSRGATVVTRGARFRGAHVYRRGSHVLRVTAYDKAGNSATKTVRLRIR